MAFAQASQPRTLAEMNITPLVDVLLVMLVIFMISAPVFSRPIPLDIAPGEHAEPSKMPPIELRIDASGEVFFNDRPAPLSALNAMFSAEAVRAGEALPGVSVSISANGDADYQVVAKVLATAQNAGFTKIGFAR